MNALEDGPMIRLLYQASQAGVNTDLIVRGACCLRPQLAGVSDHIRVISIRGRFLEHSRIYYFGNDGAEECHLGSADLMSRNLDNRVEVLLPVERPELIRWLRDEILMPTCMMRPRPSACAGTALRQRLPNVIPETSGDTTTQASCKNRSSLPIARS